MKKIALLVFHNMRYCPFLKFYTNILDKIENVSYDIIYFNREKQLNEEINENTFRINWIGKYNNKKINKVFNFINYYFQVKKILDKNKYDNIIVLTTIPGVILSDYLSKKYYKKYIVDIRDYTWEKIPLYYKKEEKLLNSSMLNVISSPDFVSFLPNTQFLVCHNLNIKKLMPNKKLIKNRNTTIDIAYIGSVSYENQCIKLIDLVFNDNRFRFDFYGNETNGTIISDYIANLKCDRIKYFGPYTPDQTEILYEKSDLIFNCYGNETSLVKYAISNKYYFGMAYHRPLLVSPSTTMSMLVGKYGYNLDLDEETKLDGLYKWYNELDDKEFDNFANKSLEGSIKNNQDSIEQIINIISEEKND